MVYTVDKDRALQPVPARVELARIAATAVQAAKSGARVLLRRRECPARERAAHELRNGFAALGPTYVKLGQLIASSPGVFPEVVSNEFRTLLDRVPPADPAAIEQVLHTELGATPTDIFAWFDPEPLASASIAQVHRARLISGEEVVVKIQRPAIKLRLAADLQIMKRIAAGLELSAYGRMLSAREIVEDFETSLREELDFATEARAMEEWIGTVANSQFADQVRVPRVYWAHTTSRVLTMEYIDATRIDDADAIHAAGFDGVQLVRTLLLSLLESAFHGGIFHGDLHAGNVLIDDKGKLVYLDFGIVGRFDASTRVILRQLIGDLLVHKNFEAAGRALYKMGAVRRPGTVKDAAKEIRDFTDPLVTTDLGNLSYTALGRQLASLAKTYDARLPRELVLVAKQLLYVERYMKLLAPKWEAIGDPELFVYMVNVLNEAEAERSLDAEDAR
ncbi:ABC1 kinase family protein [Nocardia nepalensis]|uniref:ABC1 kinase family protein n=1 Tax=Nocardia nepalensis TaxID=3375448 RepID=UPI003B66BDBD